MKSAYQLLHSMDPTLIVCLTENANYHTLCKTNYCTAKLHIYMDHNISLNDNPIFRTTINQNWKLF